jgi:hypothetical protein
MAILELHCWKCDASLAEVPLPLSRYAQCPACEVDLYTCRLCTHYDPRWNNACREERAEAPREKARANFCDWFKPNPDAHTPPASDPNAAARSALDSLFGAEKDEPTPDPARNPLDDLFKPKP